MKRNSRIKTGIYKAIGYACATLVGGAIGVYTGILSQTLLGKITNYRFDPAGLRTSAVLGAVLGVFLGWRTARKLLERKDKGAKSGVIRIISHIDGILTGALAGAFLGAKSGKLYAYIINYQDVPIVYVSYGILLGIPIAAGLGALAVNRILKRIDRKSLKIKKGKPTKKTWVKRTAFTVATLALFGIYSSWAYMVTVPAIVRKYRERDILVDSPITYKWFLHPEFSPDGKQIVFMGKRARWLERTDPMEILVADSDGTNIRRLVRNSWNLNPFWINDEWVGFFQQHREGSNLQWIPYKVSASGEECSRLETKYPGETGIRMKLLYYSDSLEIVWVWGWKDDKRFSKVYVNGKLNKLVQDWEDFAISPGGTRAAYTKKKDLYIQPIKPIERVKSIKPIGKPVIRKSCLLLGFIEQGRHKGSMVVQDCTNEIIMLNQDGEKISTIGKGDIGYRGFDLAPDGKSIVHAKEGDIWRLELCQK